MKRRQHDNISLLPLKAVPMRVKKKGGRRDFYLCGNVRPRLVSRKKLRAEKKLRAIKCREFKRWTKSDINRIFQASLGFRLLGDKVIARVKLIICGVFVCLLN